MVNNEIIKLKFDNSFNGRLFAVQGDTGRVFNLQVFDDYNKPVDVTGMKLRMYVANSKEVSYSEGEIVEAAEGKVKVQVYNSQLKYPGKQKAQFVLTDKDGQKIGSKIFDLWVEEGLETGSTVGNNIYVDFDKINQILDLIKNYDKTLEEAKKVDSSLKLEIKEGTDARNNLADCKKKALEIKGQLDTSKVDAQNVLKEFTSAKNTLIDENKKASSNLTSLDAKIAEGKQTVTNLEGKTSAAKATDAILKATDTEAKNTESLIRDLMSQLGKTENEVKQIIAAGDLSKYVTDPKLQEALKSYATKEDLSKIDVKSQLVDYAKKTEIPTKLSQLNNDKTFKTETEILQLINNVKKLKKEVVTSLPTTGKEDVIYLLKNKNDTNNYYTEYMWISGKWEIIGDTKVDLSGYAKKTEVVTSVNGKKGDMMVDFFVGDDTRNQSYAPKDYLERGARYKSFTNSQFEFKRCTTVGVDRLITQDYCIVNTQVPWADKSGGLPMQIAYGKGVMATRTAKDENTWGEWQKVSTSNDLSGYAKTTDLPTKLSQLSEDENHRTVTDSEKSKWNKKFELPQGKENQVLTKTTNGAEFKNISSSRSATFVIANYDSSENSKSGADYVIQENESPCDVINGFIEKLPNYGGKIQLTEGNFIEKNDKSINLNKDNITLSGNGQSTNLKRTIENAKIEFIRIVNSNIILEDLQSNSKYENAVWFSENANKCKMINIVGTSSTRVFSINGSNHQLSNCTGTSTNGKAFNIDGSNHSLSNCTGTSTDGVVFNISGSNHQLSNCTGTSTDDGAFSINGSGISLVSCIGENNPKQTVPCFYINGTNNQLSNCIGTSTIAHSFYIGGSNHSLLNCLGITDSTFALAIDGSGISLVGCIGKSKNPNKHSIFFSSNSRLCVGLANRYYNSGLSNKGTNNVLANNIKLEV
jgi:hypothetical protein